jgi:hypothetical protein
MTDQPVIALVVDFDDEEAVLGHGGSCVGMMTARVVPRF